MANAAQMSPDDYSLLDPKVQACPHQFYQAMHEQDPVHQMPETGFFIVSSFKDCVAAASKPEVFSSKMGFRVMEEPPEVTKMFQEAGCGEIVDTLVTNDPPSHTRFRKLVNAAFTVGRVSRLTPHIESIINGEIDNWNGKPEIEIVKEYAIPITMKIIADQLGVSRSDMDKFKTWSDACVAPLGGMITKEEYIVAAGHMIDMMRYFTARIEERRAQPRDDMLNDLVYARTEGEKPLDVKEMHSVITQLLVAGNETTTSAIAAAVMLLCRNPDVFQQLKSNPELCGNFAEETLRIESPAGGLFRMALQDAELGGKKIPKGSMLQLRYAAANVDESVFADALKVRLDRPQPRRHLSFGSGIHTCIGAQLARKEIECASRELVKRLKSIRFSPRQGELEYAPSLILHGLTSLLVEVEYEGG
jgi:cytochrome P450